MPKALIVSSLLLISSAPTLARASCLADELASSLKQAQALAARKAKSNELVFGHTRDLDPALLNRFQAAPRFDGSVYIPPDIGITTPVRLEGTNRTVMASFETGSIRAQKKVLRKLMRDIKTRSQVGNAGIGREFGTMIVNYEDGSSKVIQYTSNLPTETRGADIVKAVDGSGLKSDPRPVRRILVIHTHPDPRSIGYKSMIPLPQDFHQLEVMRKGFFSFHWGPRGPDWQGIVLPNCPDCEDLFFRYRPGGLEPLKESGE